MSLLQNLSGALDLMLGREEGLEKIDLSADGFWRSFVGLGLVGIIDVVTLMSTHRVAPDVEQFQRYSALSAAIVSVAIYIFAYLASCLALYFMCTTTQLRQRFPYAVIVNNWAAPLFSGALALPIMMTMKFGGAEGTSGSALFWISVIVLMLFVSVRLLKSALLIPTGHALMLVAAMSAVSWILESWLTDWVI